MSDLDRATELAEEYWRRHAEPILKRVVVDAYLTGTTFVPAALANWVASMPTGPNPEASSTPPASPAQEQAPQAQHGGEKAGAPLVEPRPKRSVRPLKGASAAAYDAVKRAGGPLTSRELLGHLRRWDGRERTEERDNTLLAAMRRLRSKGWLDFDGTHYSIPAKSPSGKGKPSRFEPDAE